MASTYLFEAAMRVLRSVRIPALAVAAATVLIATPGNATPPQSPLAAGSYRQLAEVMSAAEKCGFRAFRIASEEKSPKKLYTNGDSGSYPCIEAWLKRSARRVGLVPRWEGDTYQ